MEQGIYETHSNKGFSGLANHLERKKCPRPRTIV